MGEEGPSVGRSIARREIDPGRTIGKSLTLLPPPSPRRSLARSRRAPIVRLIGLRHVLYIMAVLKMRFNDI